MGYGTQAIKLVVKYFQGEFPCVSNNISADNVFDTEKKVNFYY